MNTQTQTHMEKAKERFLILQKKTADKNAALHEYETKVQARIVKTAGLRALRLAKEEADRIAATKKPASAKRQRASKNKT